MDTRKNGQSKVSIAIPCYNKEEYITRTFDCIIAQTWDNIEVVLTNDGSTDGTRGIISEYEPKFRERGYEVVVIDQENAGVIAAGRAGLAAATGDYVCQVDSDDELDPEYVSAPAVWLDAHPECDFTICEELRFEDTADGRKEWLWPQHKIREDDNEIGPEHYFLCETINPTVFIYMARNSYIRRLDIASTYDTGMRGSHEPGYIVPLLAGGGGRKFIPKPLYQVRVLRDSYSRGGGMEHYRKYYDTYDELSRRAIDALPDAPSSRHGDVPSAPTPENKRFWMRCCRLSSGLRLYRYAVSLGELIPEYAEHMLAVTADVFGMAEPIAADRIGIPDTRFTAILEDCVFGRMKPEDKERFPELVREGMFR